jgi:hypothetical protein
VQKAVSLQFSLGRPVPLPCSILALPSRVVLSAGVFAPGLTIVQLGDLGSEATRLKSQCDALKTQRLALTTEVTSQTSELSAIRSEVERLTRERDALQLEYKTENEINDWYLRRELCRCWSGFSHSNDWLDGGSPWDGGEWRSWKRKS